MPVSFGELELYSGEIPEEMSMAPSVNELVGSKLSDYYVEKHEHPSGSKMISEFPVRVWVVPDAEEDAVEISVGPAGCSIEVATGKPHPVDMAEYGRTLILPQFLDDGIRTQSVVRASIEPSRHGEILVMQLSDGSELSYACDGDDELRPSIDQSQI